MADAILKIHNDGGARELFVSAKRFECMGASPPHDHPHVYLEMGDDNEIICPYCSTKFIYQA